MQEAGADAVIEMAFTIADGIQYCRTGKEISPFSLSNELRSLQSPGITSLRHILVYNSLQFSVKKYILWHQNTEEPFQFYGRDSDWTIIV